MSDPDATSAVIADLRWRGLIAHSTDLDALARDLSDGPVTLYYGCDPTAPSLHVGNLVGLLVLRRFQLAGHRPIALAGGATGFIGDPGGRASERSLMSADQVGDNVARIGAQLVRFVDLSPGAGLLVDNLDWTAPLTVLDFLRDVGKHFSVNTMLAKDSVRSRLEGAGISYTEFSYMLLQALDFLELYRRHGCRLQIGGSDQWGNLTAGLDLIRRVEGISAHAVSWPLLTTASGQKFGKSSGGGGLWLDPELTTPYAFYQYWLGTDDGDVGSYLRFFSFRDQAEIEALDEATATRPAARAAQRALAAELTSLVHGPEETRRVEAASAAVFGQGRLEELDCPTLRAAVEALPSVAVGPGPLPSVAELLDRTGLCPSRSAARRTVAEGGAYVNNRRVSGGDEAPAVTELLHGRWLIIRRGRRGVAAVEHRRAPAGR